MDDKKNEFCITTFGMPLMAAYAEYGNLVNFLWGHEQKIDGLDAEITELKAKIAALENNR